MSYERKHTDDSPDFHIVSMEESLVKQTVVFSQTSDRGANLKIKN